MKQMLFFLTMITFFLAGCGNQYSTDSLKKTEPTPSLSFTSQTDEPHYIYEDLGLRVTTSSGQYITRTGDILYNAQSSTIRGDYMEVFFKDPGISFEEEIRKNHLSPECDILTGILDYTDGLFASMQGFSVIYITTLDGNLASNGEVFDLQFPENTLSIAFVMDPQHPEKYYKFSYGDCAPGPCSIFESIEFF